MSLIVALMSVLPMMAQRVKVACVGNSVTYGYGLPRQYGIPRAAAANARRWL